VNAASGRYRENVLLSTTIGLSFGHRFPVLVLCDLNRHISLRVGGQRTCSSKKALNSKYATSALKVMYAPIIYALKIVF